VIDAANLLKTYLQSLLEVTQAHGASLGVGTPVGGAVEPLLIHVGAGTPLPELDDSTAVQKLIATAADDNTGPVVVRSSRAGEGILIGLRQQVVDDLAAEAGAERHDRRRRSDEEEYSEETPSTWIGLRFPPGTPPPSTLQDDPSVVQLLRLGVVLANHSGQVSSVFQDPVTGLPDRPGFQALIDSRLAIATRKKRPLTLLLVNPDNFAPINEMFGREAGDDIIQEFSRRLRNVLRTSDPIARYGGVIFAVVLEDTEVKVAISVAEKLLNHLSESAFLDGAVRLASSIGLSHYDGTDERVEQSHDLIRQAEQALNAAKRDGGGRIALWDRDSANAEEGAFDRLAGLFTANLSKDYRNMVLLWEALSAIASAEHFETLADQIAERLYATFKPDRIGLFARGSEGTLDLLRGMTRQLNTAEGQRHVETVELVTEKRDLIEAAMQEQEPYREVFPDSSGGVVESYAVPLVVGQNSLGCLYLDGREGLLQMDSSDVVFLQALASQIGVALDRSQLAEAERSHQEQQQRLLRAELNDLRHALQLSKLAYRSGEMEALVSTARRVAPTDATVLVTGESGTGKELISKTLHELSNRRQEPFVIVDCGAIASTLIESELFGAEKGSYTGAQARRRGRLAEADGGTVLLDEIGELPLEVQTKLLRFVQEKQFTPIGSTRPRHVDVRIIAATNRDLSKEVAEGRFREDLYYRLNVVRLQVPPLRSRPDDILHLARHFLETFSVQYQKPVHGITPETEQLMLSYSWPGNIRELQNRLMQAVILAEGPSIEPHDLGIPLDEMPSPAAPVAGNGASQESRPGLSRPTNYASPATSYASPAPSAPAAHGQNRPTARFSSHAPEYPTGAAIESNGHSAEGRCSSETLRACMGRQIDIAAAASPVPAIPLGRWLSDDLILAADRSANSVARAGASIIGIPETTFRRRIRKAASKESAGLAPRSNEWHEVRELLDELVRNPPADEEDLTKYAENLLLAEILLRYPDNIRVGSSLLGVTAPTYRRRVAQFEALQEK